MTGLPAERAAAVWSARRALLVTRVLLAVATAAVVISQLIIVTTDDQGSPSDSGARRLAQFLAGVSLPIVLIAAVLALTVAVSIYVERLDVTPHDDVDRSASDVHPSSPVETAVPIVGRQPMTLPDQSMPPDDTAWRPT